MGPTLVLHVAAGTIGLVAGFIALYATKGARLHRRAGVAFVCAMLAMSVAGSVVAAVQGVAPALNVPAGVLTAYLVVTGFTAVRPPFPGSRRLDVGAMLVVVGVSLLDLRFAFEAIANGGTRGGMPSFPWIMFGVVGLLAGVGDARMLRAGGPLRGPARLARHLWRMSFALFIAAMSFFIGQADVFPAPIRIRPLLAMPVLAVLVTMFYWMWRVRARRPLRSLSLDPAPTGATT